MLKTNGFCNSVVRCDRKRAETLPRRDWFWKVRKMILRTS